MGIDAMIYVSGVGITPERLEQLRAQMDDDDGGLRTFVINSGPWIRHGTWQRYFGESYPRGHWPTIRRQIRWMQNAFPDRPVFYSGDCIEFGMVDEWTEEDMQAADIEWSLWSADWDEA